MNVSAAKRLLKPLLALACFALLAWMVLQAGPRQLWQTLCTLPLTIALCVVVWGVGYLLCAVSFRQVIIGVGYRPSYLSVLGITISGYAINYITPFGLLGGEPYRVVRLRPLMGTEHATQCVVLYSMMHVASHFCFWIIAAVAAALTLGARAQGGVAVSWWLLAVAVVCGALLLLFWRLFRRGIAPRFMSRWVNWPLLRASLLAPRRCVTALLLELLSRLVNVIEYWLIMQAMGYASFTYVDALLVVAFSSLLANILFFSPLQMGTREGGILLALQYLLRATLMPVALTLSFATRIREFVWIIIGLVIALLNKTKTSTR